MIMIFLYQIKKKKITLLEIMPEWIGNYENFHHYKIHDKSKILNRHIFSCSIFFGKLVHCWSSASKQKLHNKNINIILTININIILTIMFKKH
jgi:hypothetical protein